MKEEGICFCNFVINGDFLSTVVMHKFDMLCISLTLDLVVPVGNHGRKDLRATGNQAVPVPESGG